jgi:hypothetical protein
MSWLVKFLLPLLGFAALSASAAWILPKSRPHITSALADPAAFEGRTVWVSAREVTGYQNGLFTLGVDGFAVRVRSDRKPGTGKHVSVTGTFRAPDIVEARPEDVKEFWNWSAQRYFGAYGISVIVLAVWAFFFLKRFRLGIRGGLFHPIPPATPPPPPPEKA